MSALGLDPARLTCVGWPPNVGACGALGVVHLRVLSNDGEAVYLFCLACGLKAQHAFEALVRR